VVGTQWLPFVTEIVLLATLIAEVLFKRLLICTAVEHSWQQSSIFSGDKYVNGVHSVIV